MATNFLLMKDFRELRNTKGKSPNKLQTAKKIKQEVVDLTGESQSFMVDGKTRSQDSPRISSNINPLFIPSVVSEILSYLHFEDVQRSRQVCRVWTEEGTTAMASKGQFILKSKDDIRNFVKQLKSKTSPSRLGAVKKFGIKLCPESSTVGGDSKDKCLLETKECKEMLKLIGKKLHSLILDLDAWRWKENALWQLLYKDAPNLELLGLSAQNVDTNYNDDSAYWPNIFKSDGFSRVMNNLNGKLLPNVKHLILAHPNRLKLEPISNLVTDLFSRMPNLRKLTCDDDKAFREEIIWRFFRIEDFYRFNPSFVEFDFNLDLNEEEVKKFHELLKYPLESLQLSLRPGLRFPALYQFISSLGPTLTTLQINFVFTPLHSETFPCGQDLVNLRTLSLRNFKGPLNFLHHTKKLENLILSNVNLSVAFTEEDDFDRPHGLKSLEVFGGHSNAGRFSFPHIFRKMVKLFPKLKKFRMDYLTDANIQTISEGFLDMEELFLDNSVCTDEGVTGIHLSRLKDFSTSTEWINLEGSNRLPSIVTLKRLKTLFINSPMISDKSLRFGIRICKELRNLSLSSPQITGGELEEIAKALHLRSLRLLSCYRVTETEASEISKALPQGASFNRVMV